MTLASETIEAIENIFVNSNCNSFHIVNYIGKFIIFASAGQWELARSGSTPGWRNMNGMTRSRCSMPFSRPVSRPIDVLAKQGVRDRLKRAGYRWLPETRYPAAS
jgi:hypothetical protein